MPFNSPRRREPIGTRNVCLPPNCCITAGRRFALIFCPCFSELISTRKTANRKARRVHAHCPSFSSRSFAEAYWEGRYARSRVGALKWRGWPVLPVLISQRQWEPGQDPHSASSAMRSSHHPSVVSSRNSAADPRPVGSVSLPIQMHRSSILSSSTEKSPLLNCLVHAFRYFAGVTATILTDNMKTVVQDRVDGQPSFHPRFLAKIRGSGAPP